MKFSEVDLKVIQGIKNAVEDRGADWVYPDEWRNEYGRCLNLYEGQGACIIGYIAVDQGLPTEAHSSAIRDAYNWGVSWVVGEAMSEAQEVQDSGATWGEALKAFEGELGMTVDEALTNA